MSECMCDDYGNDLCTVHGGTQDQIIERAAARIATLEGENARLTELIQHLESWKAPNGQFFDLTNPEAQVAPVLEENTRLKEELQYATAPVDKGIPKRIYDVVCKERDAANDRNAALREAVREFGEHYPSCPARNIEDDESACDCGLYVARNNPTQSAADWRERIGKDAVDHFITGLFHQETGDIADTDKFRESLLAVYRKFKPGGAYTWEVTLGEAILYWEGQATKPLREALATIHDSLCSPDGTEIEYARKVCATALVTSNERAAEKEGRDQ